MARVEIENKGGNWSVKVDGTELAKAIRAGGLRVDFGGQNEFPTVSIDFMATELSMHLDEATVEARQQLLTATEKREWGIA